MTHSIALFLHVIGAITICVGIGILIFGATAIRLVRNVPQLRAIAMPLTARRKVGFEHISAIDAVVVSGVALIVFPAFYMVTSAWSFHLGWIRVAVASFVLIAPLGPFVINPRLHAIARAAAAAPDGPVDSHLFARTDSLILGTSLHIMTAVCIGLASVLPLLKTPRPRPADRNS